MKKYFNVISRLSKDDKRGVSLIIAIIFVSAFMLVLAGLAEVQIRTLQNIRNHDQEGKASYLAQSAAEVAAFFAANAGVGATTEDLEVSGALDTARNALSADAADLGITCVDCIGFKVVGRSERAATVMLNNAAYFSVPAATVTDGGVVSGTGDAAESCTIVGANAQNTANDSCHWDKLSFGESVEIPLYYETTEANRTVVHKPDFGNEINGKFKIRVRAPCEMNAAGQCVTPVLFPSINDAQNYRDIDKDPVLVQWLISDSDGGETMVAADVKDRNKRYEYKQGRDPQGRMINGDIENTEISAGRINASKMPNDANDALDDFTVVDISYKGKDLSIVNDPTIRSFLSNDEEITRPVLRLSLVTHPQKCGDPNCPDKRNVPYLEYQILLGGGSTPVADSKSQIVGWARVGDFYRKVTRSRTLPATLGGFVLESF